MTKLRTIFKQFFIGLSLLILTCGMPAAAFADATSDGGSLPATTQSALPPATTAISGADQTAAPVATPADGTTDKPTGASAGTYHYNQTSKLWENDHYTWDPVAGVPVPKVAPTYTYNSATGMWDTSLWLYDAASGNFVLTPTSVATPPSGAVTSGGPAAGQPAVLPVVATTPPANATAPAAADTTAPDKSTVSNVTLATTVNSQAQSGNALLQNNNTAGNATSGAASAAATVLNLLQSSSSLGGSGVTTFTKDIQGSDMPGDFVIDPASFLQTATAPTTSNLSVRSQTSGTIFNNIDLSATSGSATILDNKQAGDATTGTASAVANVMNMINSVVAANQSFVGIINIYGDYSGNILIPTDSLQTLLGSNGTPGTAAAGAADTAVTTNSQQNIANNVDLAATSGDATLLDNKYAGSATTGNAMTNLTILNLTGHQVTAANSLLVFVNVLGTWVGVIMDAPAGATSAALTGNSSDGGAGSNISAAPSATNNMDLAGASNLEMDDSSNIINNITAHARSGDAAVTSNKKAGDATSGSATASANIVNIINSTFSLSHWFGVLFINVFGSWHGSVAAQKPPAAASGDTSDTAKPVQAVKVFGFSGGGSGLGLAPVAPSSFSSSQYQALVTSVGNVLAAHDVVHKIAHQQTPAPVVHQQRFSLSVLPIALGITGLTAVGAERVRLIRHKLGIYRQRTR